MIPKFRAWDRTRNEMIDEILMISFGGNFEVVGNIFEGKGYL